MAKKTPVKRYRLRRDHRLEGGQRLTRGDVVDLKHLTQAQRDLLVAADIYEESEAPDDGAKEEGNV